MNNADSLQEGLKRMLNYLPMIYNQRQTSTVNEGIITIRYPYNQIPDNALLFVLPLYGSIENVSSSNPNKLAIQFASVSQDGSIISYQTQHVYNIMIEGLDGLLRAATTGDIVPNRLCMFRFVSNNSSEVILCNNPIYNNLSSSTLCVTSEAKFLTIPKYVYTSGGNEIEDELVLKSELTALTRRVQDLENKIKIGTSTAEKYFEDNPDAPNGTIYMQMEE